MVRQDPEFRRLLFALITAGGGSQISATRRGGLVFRATIPHNDLNLASLTGLPIHERRLRRLRDPEAEDADAAVRIHFLCPRAYDPNGTEPMLLGDGTRYRLFPNGMCPSNAALAIHRFRLSDGQDMRAGDDSTM
jgi:hypothetical protein